jgi:hypothetical protein
MSDECDEWVRVGSCMRLAGGWLGPSASRRRRDSLVRRGAVNFKDGRSSPLSRPVLESGMAETRETPRGRARVSAREPCSVKARLKRETRNTTPEGRGGRGVKTKRTENTRKCAHIRTWRAHAGCRDGGR